MEKDISVPMELKQFNEIIRELTDNNYIVRVFDPEKKDLVYSFTEDGLRFYNAALTLLGKKTDPINDMVYRELQFSSWFTQYTTKTAERKFGLSMLGLHRFFVMDRIVDKAQAPVPMGIKVAQHLFKATQVMGKTAEMMNSLTSKMGGLVPPPEKPQRKTKVPTKSYTNHSASWEAPRKSDFGKLDNLSKFPKSRKRKDWFDI